MSFKELAKERFTVRQFDSNRPVEQEKIDEILEQIMVAPTAANMQPQKIKMFQTPDELAIAGQISRCLYGSPLAFLICYDNSGTIKHANLDAGVCDSCIIATHMMLRATELGLGSCWAIGFDPAKARELLNLPENIVPVVFMPIGYAADGVTPHTFHETTKPIDALML